MQEHGAALLHSGRRIPIDSAGVTIGRGDDNDIVIDGERVSRRHARITLDQSGRFAVEDLGSRHGTRVNDEPLEGSRGLRSGDAISIDEELLRFVAGAETRVASGELPVLETQVVQLTGERVTIGRDPSNQVVLPDPNVSRFHAELVARNGGWEVVDLGSRNGTRVGGEPVERHLLQPGTQVGVGPYRLAFDGAEIVTRDERGAMRLDAFAVSVQIRDKRILDDVSVAVEPGDFVAVIGESGSGKSTLLKALAGVSAPSGGAVTVNDDPVTARLTDVGYVPQDDIVHPELTVREALKYAARLRLPADTTEEEIASTVDRALGAVALEPHADTRIGSLSGGQRKRTGVAAELLGRPSLLFLDEPTTGLDPGLETKMMGLLRELADDSRAVVVVTHATKNLGLCDKVAVMGRGGHLTYYGSPAEARDFFGVSDYDGIYDSLAAREPTEWRALFELDGDTSRAARAAPAARPARRRRPNSPVRSLAHAATLGGRYLKVMLRDRRNLALLIGQVPLLALANVGLFKSGVFDMPGGRPSDGVQLLFMLVITVVWLGAIDSSREIVKERSVLEREAAAGVGLGAYLSSKAAVLFALVTLQTLLFAAIVFAFRPLDQGTGAYLEVCALLVLTGWVAVAMGLAISAFVSSEDQATSITPLAVIPLLLFAGAIVPVQQMGAIVKGLSYVMFSQWSLASVGTAADMNARIAGDPAFARANTFGSDFFDVAAGTGLLVLGAFLVAFLSLTAFLLARSVRR
jgi:ABC-type multidrug transport system ATPase subunit/ABC-type multidrug transport system permease subunit